MAAAATQRVGQFSRDAILIWMAFRSDTVDAFAVDLFLAFSETLGKSAQTEAMNLNIKASNLWNFFQAKTIRRTVLLTAVEAGRVGAYERVRGEGADRQAARGMAEDCRALPL
jgi:Domain of unknown function (DUF4337)